MNPARFSSKTWNRFTAGSAVVLGAMSVALWLPARTVSILNPSHWGLAQWVATGLLVLIGVGLAALHAVMAAQREDLDTAWDEIEKLRNEVTRSVESVHQLALTVAGRPSTVVMSSPVEPKTGPIEMSDAPTTVTGIPSARPRVPSGASRLDMRLDEEESSRRQGRHAAAD